MDGADQVWRLRVGHIESEMAFGVGCGASGFFHAFAEFEQDDVVADGGLPVVEFLTVPVRVWAAKDREENRRRVRRQTMETTGRLENSLPGLGRVKAGMGSPSTGSGQAFDCARGALARLLLRSG